MCCVTRALALQHFPLLCVFSPYHFDSLFQFHPSILVPAACAVFRAGRWHRFFFLQIHPFLLAIYFSSVFAARTSFGEMSDEAGVQLVDSPEGSTGVQQHGLARRWSDDCGPGHDSENREDNTKRRSCFPALRHPAH
ncbi:hypothetical protein BDZ91DRAFT_809120, partial [Kalaharituber pfeilii]